MLEKDNRLSILRQGAWTLVAGLRWELLEGRRGARQLARRYDADKFVTVSAGNNRLLVGVANLREVDISPALVHGWGGFKIKLE